MRLLVNCPSGASHLLQLEVTTKFIELKKVLQDLEGVPVGQQVLAFAGQECKDHFTFEDYKLGYFSLADEVVLYLSTRLAQPKLIYLAARSKPSQFIPENVECTMPVGQVMGLLESRGLATSFRADAAVIAKRQDGSTIPLHINPEHTVDQLEAQLGEREGMPPTRMTFQQAQDGCMHVLVYPSSESSTATYPVYSRSTRPQPVMMVQPRDMGQPLPDLVQELCVLP